MNSPDTLSTRSSCVPISHDHRLVHAEDGEQLAREEEEEQSDERRAASPMRAATCTACVGAVRLARAEILPGDRAPAAPIRPIDVHVMSEKSCE